MITDLRKLGDKGEKLVAQWLENKHYSILAYNYTSRTGELDLVATKGDVISFVEVKTRTASYFPIATTVTLSKQRKIIRTAKNFILQNKIRDRMLQFDIATVLLGGGEPIINYISNAFQETSD